MRRQERLEQPALEFSFMLDEEALHRWIGGPRVMYQQLQHLLEVAEQPNVSLQVVPFTAGAHPGLRGPFILLHLDETDEDVLFLESVSGDQLIRDDPERIKTYTEYFKRLRDIALPDQLATALLKELADRYRKAAETSDSDAAEQ
jgi:Domain of unknown function (DUF5753)